MGIYSCVERYNRVANEWELVPCVMTVDRSCFGCCFLDGEIYAVGGYGPLCLNRWVRAPASLEHIGYSRCVSRAFFFVITGRNEVVAKVMFLLVSVILSTKGGVCLSACWDTTPPEQTPPQSRCPPGADTPQEQTPPGKQTPPPPGADTPPGADPPLGADTPLEQTNPWSRHLPGSRHLPRKADSSIRSMSGRYASYWNAFLLFLNFVCNTPRFLANIALILILKMQICKHTLFTIISAQSL